MDARPNTVSVSGLTIHELDILIQDNASMYERYKHQPFEEQHFRERVRYLNVKKEALLKKIARRAKRAKNESNEVR